MLALKKFRNKRRGMADYLNYGNIVAPDIVACKDGSLLIGRYIKGRNLTHGHETDWWGASAAANRAIGKLSGGWALWIDDVRLPVSRFTDPARNHFPDSISQMIEDERRETFTKEGACLESEYAVILHYTPPMKRKRAIVNLMYSKDTTNRPAAATAVLNGFRNTVREFDGNLGANMEVRPMLDRRWTDERGREQLRSDLVNYLNFCVSGILLDIPLPPHGCYLDAIFEKPIVPGNMPKIGDMFTACVSISGYPWPEGSTPGVFSTLDSLPFPLRWSSRYIVLDQPEAEKQQQIIEKTWMQKARGIKGYFFEGSISDPDAEEMAGTVADMKRRTRSATEGTGYYTPCVILMDEDPYVLEEHARIVSRAIEAIGYPTRIETVNTIEAFMGALPGHCYPNVRRVPVHTTNLADLIPLSSPWQGLETVPSPLYPPDSPPLIQAVTTGETPIDIGVHTGDLGHFATFGPPGAGKSTLLNTTVMSALRYRNAMVWGFDKGRTMMPTFRAVGKFYDIGNDNLAFCPLSILETDSDVAAAEEWVATCFHLQTGHATRPPHTEAIHEAIQVLRHGGGRSVSHFIRQCQNTDVKETMAFYSLHGGGGFLFDAEKDGLTDSLVCGFETSELMTMGEKILIPALQYLFRRFAKMLKGQPAFLLIDEAWTMLGHPVWRDKIVEWLRELRKSCCSVGFGTQFVSDANKSGIMDVILGTCQTVFFGADPSAMINGTDDEPGPRQLYQKFGLTDAQIEMIRQAIPKKHYLYHSPNGSALVDLRLGPKALRFVGVGSKNELKAIDALYAKHGDHWTESWLNDNQPRKLKLVG